MGFSWSSFVAQSVMLGTVHNAGFTDAQLLCEEAHLPSSIAETVSIATDDVNHFLVASASEVESREDLPLQALDRTGEHCGLKFNTDKTVDFQMSGQTLGLVLKGGTHFLAKTDRVRVI